MKNWIDEETGTRMCEPDCVDEWLFDIWAIACDYDGCRTVDEFKDLVDEIIEMSQHARNCLWDGKLFGIHGSPKTEEQILDEYIDDFIDGTSEDWSSWL